MSSSQDYKNNLLSRLSQTFRDLKIRHIATDTVDKNKSKQITVSPEKQKLQNTTENVGVASQSKASRDTSQQKAPKTPSPIRAITQRTISPPKISVSGNIDAVEIVKKTVIDTEYQDRLSRMIGYIKNPKNKSDLQAFYDVVPTITVSKSSYEAPNFSKLVESLDKGSQDLIDLAKLLDNMAINEISFEFEKYPYEYYLTVSNKKVKYSKYIFLDTISLNSGAFLLGRVDFGQNNNEHADFYAQTRLHPFRQETRIHLPSLNKLFENSAGEKGEVFVSDANLRHLLFSYVLSAGKFDATFDEQTKADQAPLNLIQNTSLYSQTAPEAKVFSNQMNIQKELINLRISKIIDSFDLTNNTSAKNAKNKSEAKTQKIPLALLAGLFRCLQALPLAEQSLGLTSQKTQVQATADTPFELTSKILGSMQKDNYYVAFKNPFHSSDLLKDLKEFQAFWLSLSTIISKQHLSTIYTVGDYHTRALKSSGKLLIHTDRTLDRYPTTFDPSTAILSLKKFYDSDFFKTQYEVLKQKYNLQDIPKDLIDSVIFPQFVKMLLDSEGFLGIISKNRYCNLAQDKIHGLFGFASSPDVEAVKIALSKSENKKVFLSKDGRIFVKPELDIISNSIRYINESLITGLIENVEASDALFSGKPDKSLQKKADTSTCLLASKLPEEAITVLGGLSDISNKNETNEALKAELKLDVSKNEIDINLILEGMENGKASQKTTRLSQTPFKFQILKSELFSKHGFKSLRIPSKFFFLLEHLKYSKDAKLFVLEYYSRGVSLDDVEDTINKDISLKTWGPHNIRLPDNPFYTGSPNNKDKPENPDDIVKAKQDFENRLKSSFPASLYSYRALRPEFLIDEGCFTDWSLFCRKTPKYAKDALGDLCLIVATDQGMSVIPLVEDEKIENSTLNALKTSPLIQVEAKDYSIIDQNDKIVDTALKTQVEEFNRIFKYAFLHHFFFNPNPTYINASDYRVTEYILKYKIITKDNGATFEPDFFDHSSFMEEYGDELVGPTLRTARRAGHAPYAVFFNELFTEKPFSMDESKGTPTLYSLEEIKSFRALKSRSLAEAALSLYDILPDPLTIKNSKPGNVFPYQMSCLYYKAFYSSNLEFDVSTNSFKYKQDSLSNITNRNASFVYTEATCLDQIKSFLGYFEPETSPKRLYKAVKDLFESRTEKSLLDTYKDALGPSKTTVDASLEYISNLKLESLLAKGFLPSKLDKLGILAKDTDGNCIVVKSQERHSTDISLGLVAPDGFSSIKTVEINSIRYYKTIILLPEPKAINNFEDVKYIFPFETENGPLKREMVLKELELLYPEHVEYANTHGNTLPPSKPEQAILPSDFLDMLLNGILPITDDQLLEAYEAHKANLTARSEHSKQNQSSAIKKEDNLNEKITKITDYISYSLSDKRISGPLGVALSLKDPTDQSLTLWLNKAQSPIPGWIRASECKNYITTETFISEDFTYTPIKLITPIEYVTRDSDNNPTVIKIPFWYALKTHYESLGIDIVFAPDNVDYLGPRVFPETSLANIEISPVFPPNFFELDKTKFLNIGEVKWYEYPITINDPTFNATTKLDDPFLLASGFYSAFLGFVRTKDIPVRDKAKISKVLDELSTTAATTAESEKLKNVLNSFLSFSTEERDRCIQGDYAQQNKVINMDIVYFQLCTWWIDLSDEQRAEFVKNYTKPEALSGLKKLKLPEHYNYTLEAPKSMKTKMDAIAQAKGLENVDFHPYQKAAINACLIQDRMVIQMEMGLGKTLTALGLFNKLLDMPETGIEQMFILAPGSAHRSWTDHVEKWTTNKIRNITPGQLMSAKSFEGELYDFERKAFDIALVTKETIQDVSIFYDPNKTGKLLSLFKRIGKRVLLVVDEVHDFKGSDAKRALELRKLSEYSKRVIGMTGTLKPNTVLDIYNILEKIAPGCFGGSEDDFTQKYCLSGGDKSQNLTTFNPTKIFEFNKKSSPFIFTRLLNDADVKIELPPITTISEYKPLDEDQQRILKRLLIVLKLNITNHRVSDSDLAKREKFSDLIPREFPKSVISVLGLDFKNTQGQTEMQQIDTDIRSDPRYSISAMFAMLDKLNLSQTLLNKKIETLKIRLGTQTNDNAKQDILLQIETSAKSLKEICDNYEKFEALHPHRFKIQQMKKGLWFDEDLANLNNNNQYGLNSGGILATENSPDGEVRKTHLQASPDDKISWQIAGLVDVRSAMAFHYANEKLSISPSVLLSGYPGFEDLWDNHKPDYCSSKILYVGETVKNHLAENQGRGVIVFCEYLKGMDVLRKQLVRKFSVKDDQIEFYYGDVSQKKRLALQQRFNDPEAKEPIKVLIAQPKTLATGANLQDNCNFVVFLTTPWSPDLITQPQARVWRQGQTKPVFVIRPTCSDIDRKKEQYITSKMQGSAQAAGGSGVNDVAVSESIGESSKASARKSSNADVFSVEFLLSVGGIKLEEADKSSGTLAPPKNPLFTKEDKDFDPQNKETDIIEYTRKLFNSTGAIQDVQERHFLVEYEKKSSILKDSVEILPALNAVFDNTELLKVLDTPAQQFLVTNKAALNALLDSIAKKDVTVSVPITESAISSWTLYFVKQSKSAPGGKATKAQTNQSNSSKCSLEQLCLDAFNFTFKSYHLTQEVSLKDNNQLFEEQNALSHLIDAYRELRNYNSMLRANQFFKPGTGTNIYRMTGIKEDYTYNRDASEDVKTKLKKLLAFVCVSNNVIMLSKLICECREYLSDKKDEKLEAFYRKKELASARSLFSDSIKLSGEKLKGAQISYIEDQGKSSFRIIEGGFPAYGYYIRKPNTLAFTMFNVFNNFLTPTSFSKNSGLSFSSDHIPESSSTPLREDSLSFVNELFAVSLPENLISIIDIAIPTLSTKYKTQSSSIADAVLDKLKAVKLNQTNPDDPCAFLENNIFENLNGVKIAKDDLFRLYFYVCSKLYLIKDKIYDYAYKKHSSDQASASSESDSTFYWNIENHRLNLGTKFYDDLLAYYKIKYANQNSRMYSLSSALMKLFQSDNDAVNKFDKLLDIVSSFLLCSVLRFTLARELGILDNSNEELEKQAEELYEKLAANYTKPSEFEDPISITMKLIKKESDNKGTPLNIIKKKKLENSLRDLRALASAIDSLLSEMEDDLDQKQAELGRLVLDKLYADFKELKALYSAIS